MHPGRIHGVDGLHPGDDGRDDWSRQFVDDRAEAGVFLRRPADDGERPDGVVAVIDVLDVQHGEVVRQRVVAEVVAERAFGQLPLRIDGAGNDEVGVGGEGQPPHPPGPLSHRGERGEIAFSPPPAVGGGAGGGGMNQPHAPPAECSGEGEFRHPFGSGMTAASVIAGGPPTKTLTRNGTSRRRAAA